MLGEEDGHVCCYNVIIFMPNVCYMCSCSSNCNGLLPELVSIMFAVECVQLNFSHRSAIINSSHLLAAE